MRRRKFINLLGGAAVAWPLAARAQPSAAELPRVGAIQSIRSENSEAFSQGLRAAGYIDGQNITLDARFSLDRLDEIARELVALKCSVIFVSNPYAIRAALKATRTIPIVGVDLSKRAIRCGFGRTSKQEMPYRLS